MIWIASMNNAGVPMAIASIPFCVGIAIGYARNWLARVTLITVALIGLVPAIAAISRINSRTTFTFPPDFGATLAVLWLTALLLLFGTGIGAALRVTLKTHRFSQSDWLPLVLVASVIGNFAVVS